MHIVYAYTYVRANTLNYSFTCAHYNFKKKISVYFDFFSLYLTHHNYLP